MDIQAKVWTYRIHHIYRLQFINHQLQKKSQGYYPKITDNCFQILPLWLWINPGNNWQFIWWLICIMTIITTNATNGIYNKCLESESEQLRVTTLTQTKHSVRNSLGRSSRTLNKCYLSHWTWAHISVRWHLLSVVRRVTINDFTSNAIVTLCRSCTNSTLHQCKYTALRSNNYISDSWLIDWSINLLTHTNTHGVSI